jgi:deoxyribonuclease V
MLAPIYGDAASHAVWPSTPEALEVEQRVLSTRSPDPWIPPPRSLVVAGCFICFGGTIAARPSMFEHAWAGAVLLSGRRPMQTRVVHGTTNRPYEPGLLALREGQLLSAALQALDTRPDVVMVNATGRDHPRRAGLTVHIGAMHQVPTVGVTDRPLLATGEWPRGERGARTPLHLGGDVVGHWLITRTRARPVAVHAAWKTTPDVAVEVVLRCVRRARTPEPIRRARRTARLARAAARRGGPGADAGSDGR